MGKQSEWKRITYLRKITREQRTPITKSRNGNTVGGAHLDDEAMKPYVKQLADLEAKMAKDREAMSTKERVDDAAQEVMANDDKNTEQTQQCVIECFKKAFPKKFNDAINKWAYTISSMPSSGSANELQQGRKKVRVEGCIDKELDPSPARASQDFVDQVR